MRWCNAHPGDAYMFQEKNFYLNDTTFQLKSQARRIWTFLDENLCLPAHMLRRTTTCDTYARLRHRSDVKTFTIPLFFLSTLLRKRIADMSCYYTRHMLHSRSHLSPGSFLRLAAFLIFIIIPVFSCPILLRFFAKNVILHVSFLESLLLLCEIGKKLFKYFRVLFAEIAYQEFWVVISRIWPVKFYGQRNKYCLKIFDDYLLQ